MIRLFLLAVALCSVSVSRAAIVANDFDTGPMSTNRFVASLLGNATNADMWLSSTFSDSGNPHWIEVWFDNKFQLTNINNSSVYNFAASGYLTAGGFNGDGGGLTNLNAASLAFNFVPSARLGTNAGSDGQILSLTGDSTKWIPPSGGSANLITTNLPFTGAFLKTDGTSNYWSLNGNSLTNLNLPGEITNGNTFNVSLANASWAFGGITSFTNLGTAFGQLALNGFNNRYGFIGGGIIGAATDSAITIATTNGIGAVTATLTADNVNGVVVIGNLTCTGSKPFVIPHPLAPDPGPLLYVPSTGILRHAAVEAPRGDLLYRGSVQLTNGEAMQSIDEVSGMTPGTFEALTRSPHQAWTQNETGWQPLKIRVIGGRVWIVCLDRDSNDWVSWMVVAERKDPNYMSSSCDATGHFRVEE